MNYRGGGSNIPHTTHLPIRHAPIAKQYVSNVCIYTTFLPQRYNFLLKETNKILKKQGNRIKTPTHV